MDRSVEVFFEMSVPLSVVVWWQWTIFLSSTRCDLSGDGYVDHKELADFIQVSVSYPKISILKKIPWINDCNWLFQSTILGNKKATPEIVKQSTSQVFATFGVSDDSKISKEQFIKGYITEFTLLLRLILLFQMQRKSHSSGAVYPWRMRSIFNEYTCFYTATLPLPFLVSWCELTRLNKKHNK